MKSLCVILKKLRDWLLFTMLVPVVVQQIGAVNNLADCSQIDDLDLFTDDSLDADLLTEDYTLTGQYKNFFVDVAQMEVLEAAIFTTAAIIHECGHAIAIKSLFEPKTPIEINIGTGNPKITPPYRFFSFCNIHIYKNMPWLGGITICEKAILQAANERYENVFLATVDIAGGWVVSTFLYVLLIAITNYCAYKDNKKLHNTIPKNFLNGICPFFCILNNKVLSYKQKKFLINITLPICLMLVYQIVNAFTPYRKLYANPTSDGVNLWKKYMGVTGTPLNVAHFAAVAGLYVSVFLLLKKYCDTHKKLSLQYSKKHSPALTWTVALTSLLLMYRRLIPEL